MFGGYDFFDNYNDAWWYDTTLNTWSKQIPNNTGGSPAPRAYSTMIFNGINCIMFGGVNYDKTIWWYQP